MKFRMHLNTTRTAKLIIAASSLILLTGCSYLPKMPKLKIPELSAFPGVYKIDIEQGNIVTQEMVDELRPGMTKRQVEFLMGTPLVKNTFDQDRWDYVYSIQPGGEKRQQERLTLIFKNDALVSFSGNFAPASATPPTNSDS